MRAPRAILVGRLPRELDARPLVDTSTSFLLIQCLTQQSTTRYSTENSRSGTPIASWNASFRTTFLVETLRCLISCIAMPGRSLRAKAQTQRRSMISWLRPRTCLTNAECIVSATAESNNRWKGP